MQPKHRCGIHMYQLNKSKKKNKVKAYTYTNRPLVVF